MAKRKSLRCSTGHGTGVTPPVSLRTALEREAVRKGLKRGLRRRRMDRGSKSYRQALSFLGIAA